MVMKSVGTDVEEKTVKTCRMCNPEHQANFTAEINIHFRGIENINNPGILILPTIFVCLACGSSRFTIPESELALIARGISTRETFNRSEES
jgi:hypothetical protein